jgi:hypothetical protein
VPVLDQLDQLDLVAFGQLDLVASVLELAAAQVAEAADWRSPVER